MLSGAVCGKQRRVRRCENRRYAREVSVYIFAEKAQKDTPEYDKFTLFPSNREITDRNVRG